MHDTYNMHPVRRVSNCILLSIYLVCTAGFLVPGTNTVSPQPQRFVQSYLLTYFSGATPNNQVHLEPQLQRHGFSSEEIARLGPGNPDLTEQRPAPPDGGGGEGQGGKGEGSEGNAAGGKKAEAVPEEAGGDGGGAGPKVDFVEGPKDGDGIAR